MHPRTANVRRGRDAPSASGFTLIELMVTLAVAATLLGIAGWAMRDFIVANRVNGAAREFLMNTRKAAALAARTNQQIEVAFTVTGSDGCVPRYEIQTVGGGTIYDSVCIATEYPGVALSGGSVAAAVKCADETGEVPNCSLCSVNRTLTFYPSGEVDTSGASATGDSVIFTVGDAPSPSNTIAVGIRNVNARTRIYRPVATGGGWECP